MTSQHDRVSLSHCLLPFHDLHPADSFISINCMLALGVEKDIFKKSKTVQMGVEGGIGYEEGKLRGGKEEEKGFMREEG